MADRSFFFSTNKSLLRLTASEKFRSWLIEKGKPEYAHKASVAPEYFLVDSEFDPKSLNELVVVADQRELILRGCFQPMFTSQMVNLGLERKEWPDITNFDVFNDCYDLAYMCFGGDVGRMPFHCDKIIVEDL